MVSPHSFITGVIMSLDLTVILDIEAAQDWGLIDILLMPLPEVLGPQPPNEQREAIKKF